MNNLSQISRGCSGEITQVLIKRRGATKGGERERNMERKRVRE